MLHWFHSITGRPVPDASIFVDEFATENVHIEVHRRPCVTQDEHVAIVRIELREMDGEFHEACTLCSCHAAELLAALQPAVACAEKQVPVETRD